AAAKKVSAAPHRGNARAARRIADASESSKKPTAFADAIDSGKAKGIADASDSGKTNLIAAASKSKSKGKTKPKPNSKLLNCQRFTALIARWQLDLFRNNSSHRETVCCRSALLIGEPA
ncbi:hypothetical protein J8I87_41375, partial [Paraburkholderia sp. LEh10]|uniref:hypothetical protein n=1 Tax=Paraburkholderia sp. LEh10 TaxID=2821353 RepID=UPI001AE33E74